MRYQSAVLKLDRGTREIRWILGDPAGWPERFQGRLLKLEKGRWFYHQHAPSPTPHGTLLLFNNGNYQTFPFVPPVPPTQTYSRAVEYTIDEEKGIAREVWSSEEAGEGAVVSFAMGDVDWLPQTGNVLVQYGSLLPTDRLAEFNWRNGQRFTNWSRIRKYRHTDPAELVWEVVLQDESGDGVTGWAIFGGDRLPALLP